MKRWRRSRSDGVQNQRGTRRRSTHGRLGLAVGVVILGAACERIEVDEDPRREDGGLATSTTAELRMAMAGDPEAGEEVVAWIDDEPVPIDEARSLLGGSAGRDPAQRRMAVEGAIARRLVARADRARQGSRARQTVKDSRRDASQPGGGEWTAARVDAVPGIDALFERLRDGLSFSEDELRAHYGKTRSRYLTRQIRLRRHVLATGARPSASSRSEAPRTPRAPRAPEASDTPLPEVDSALSEVIIGPAPLHDLPPSLLPEVLELQDIGERIVIDHSDEGTAAGGTILVELLEILPAEPLSFERVRDQVAASLRTLRAQKAVRAQLAELRATSAIAIEEAMLSDDDLWDTVGASPRPRPGPPLPPFSASSPSSS